MIRKNGGRQARLISIGHTRMSPSRPWVPAAPVTIDTRAKKPGQLK
jgi:hypothetical protein